MRPEADKPRLIRSDEMPNISFFRKASRRGWQGLSQKRTRKGKAGEKEQHTI